MAGKLSIAAVAGPKEGLDVVPIYVSATNDLGIGMTGFTKGHFKLGLLSPILDAEGQQFFKLTVSKVEDLGHGLYRVSCGNSVPNMGFLNGPIILSLRIMKLTGGFGSDSGQTLVSFQVE